MRTQKAKGILKGLPKFMAHLKGNATIIDDGAAEGYHLIASREDVANYTGGFPRFGRPCPVDPAHGFVDSQKVSSREELAQMFEDVMVADPNGEIILGRSYKDVSSSLIFVDDGLLCIGPSNDGATSGHSSMSFPVCPDKVAPGVKKSAGIKPEDSVYMEGIYAKSDSGSNYHWRLVQLRGGPEMIVGSDDFVPKAIKVETVVKPHDDLLGWAKDVEGFAPGTVVYGNGHTMASHAAVHCILHNVPFVTTYEPQVGETLKVTETDAKPKISREDFRKGAHVALKSDLWGMGSLRILYFSFSVLHNWAYLRKSEHASWLLGAASASLASLCSALVLGEYRHAKSARRPHRDTVYKRAMGTTSLKQLVKLPEAFRSFCYANNWNGGYGGMKWGVCTHYTIKLYRALTNVYNGKSKSVSDAQAVQLLEAFNRLVNLVHNGGWWFNKVAQETDMDFCSSRPAFAAAGVADLYYNLGQAVSKVKKTSQKLPTLPTIRPPLLNTSEGVSWAQVVRGSAIPINEGEDFKVKVQIQKESGSGMEEMNMKFTKKEYRQIKKDPRRRLFLRTKKGEGFLAPGGRVVHK
jgi:hypothetical protein